MVDSIKELIAFIYPFVNGGWQGLVTLYVVWAIVKQFRTWQSEKEARLEAEKLGLKHNPSREVHDAIEDAVAPMRADLAEIRAGLSDVRDRVSRVEGHLDL